MGWSLEGSTSKMSRAAGSHKQTIIEVKRRSPAAPQPRRAVPAAPEGRCDIKGAPGTPNFPSHAVCRAAAERRRRP